MSVIVKGFGLGTTLIVKGFSGGFQEVILKVIYIMSRITKILGLKSERRT